MEFWRVCHITTAVQPLVRLSSVSRRTTDVVNAMRLSLLVDNTDRWTLFYMRYVSPYCYGLLLELVYICQSYRIQVTHFLAHIVDNYAVDNIIIHYYNGDKTTSGLSAVYGLLFSKISNIESTR